MNKFFKNWEDWDIELSSFLLCAVIILFILKGVCS